MFIVELTMYIYSEYFERVILCNSMVWSCSLTGKANLTFQEALDTEKLARKQIKAFPLPVRLIYIFQWKTYLKSSCLMQILYLV